MNLQMKSELPAPRPSAAQPQVLTDEQLDKVAGGATATEYAKAVFFEWFAWL